VRALGTIRRDLQALASRSHAQFDVPHVFREWYRADHVGVVDCSSGGCDSIRHCKDS
jgi:hypothetical protein